MDKYRRYYGIIVFVIIVFFSVSTGCKLLSQSIVGLSSLKSEIEQKDHEYNQKLEQKRNIERKLSRIKTSRDTVQKKIYAPLDFDLGNDTLFFTLYNDVVEMLHANSIKIKSIEYLYNPEADPFVQFSKDAYFVTELNMKLVSNYSNLGKLIQDIVQYPYYIRIKSIDVVPYTKDKKILISNVVLRLYAHTAPDNSIGQ